MPRTWAAMQNRFVETAWLRARLGDPALRIVDARSLPHGAPGQGEPTGAERYAVGHLPGAIHLDYAHDLADQQTPYATRVAPAREFAMALGSRGIGDGATIVAYDDGDVPYAARFVWMCLYYGHDDVAILAGGIRGWERDGGPLETAVPHYAPEAFTPRERPRLRASRDEVLAIAEGRSDAQLLETQRDKSYAQRSVDIAGARRLSGNALLEDARGGRIAPREILDALTRGLDPSKRTIVTCGSGVSASGSFLALQEAGFTDVAVYDGSWLEWSHDGLPTVAKA